MPQNWPSRNLRVPEPQPDRQVDAGRGRKEEDHEQQEEVQRATRAERTPVGPGGRRRSAGRRGRASRGWLDEHSAIWQDTFLSPPSPSTPRPRPPSTPGRVRRRLQEHRQRRQLDRGQHRTTLIPSLFHVHVRPRPRPHDPHHALRRDGVRRRLQDHGRRRQLEPGEHGAHVSKSHVLRRRPRPRPHDPDHPLRRDAAGGVFKSTDGGASWSPVNTGLTCPGAQVHLHSSARRRPRPRPHDPDHPLRRDVSDGVFKSTTGATSEPGEHGAGRTFPCSSRSALALDPTTPTTLYAGTDRSGVFKSTDGGATWSAVNTGLTDPSRRLRPRPRPHDPDHPLRGDATAASSRAPTGAATWSRGEHGADVNLAARLSPSPSTRRPRPPSTPGRTAAASSRARRGRELEPGEHGADDPHVTRPRPRPRPHDPDHPLRGDVVGGVFKSTTGARAGAR